MLGGIKDYELYHDESKKVGYWHGLFLVPTHKKELIIDYLHRARNYTGYSFPVSLKRIRKRGKLYDRANSWLQIGIGSLRSQTKSQKYPIFLGEKENYHYLYPYFEHHIGTEFILFRETKSHKEMNNFPDHASKIETTFRMGLKGGLHLLGRDDEYLHITRIHFDGYEHYQRHVDTDRVRGRLKGLRDYCSISNDRELIDDRSSDHRKDDCQDYEDCQLLQLTDLLVGSFRTVLGATPNEIHRSIVHPVRELVNRYRQGYARMQNSRWRNSFCMSQCYLDDGSWKFEAIEYELNDLQLPLF